MFPYTFYSYIIFQSLQSMQWFWLLLFLHSVHCNLHLSLTLNSTLDMSASQFAQVLNSADLSFAGEPFSKLVAYEDEVINVRTVSCAAGYVMVDGKCSPCACAVQTVGGAKIHFKPL